jgi:hypothetical protein
MALGPTRGRAQLAIFPASSICQPPNVIDNIVSWRSGCRVIFQSGAVARNDCVVSDDCLSCDWLFRPLTLDGTQKQLT